MIPDRRMCKMEILEVLYDDHPPADRRRSRIFVDPIDKAEQILEIVERYITKGSENADRRGRSPGVGA